MGPLAPIIGLLGAQILGQLLSQYLGGKQQAQMGDMQLGLVREQAKRERESQGILSAQLGREEARARKSIMDLQAQKRQESMTDAIVGNLMASVLGGGGPEQAALAEMRQSAAGQSALPVSLF